MNQAFYPLGVTLRNEKLSNIFGSNVAGPIEMAQERAGERTPFWSQLPLGSIATGEFHKKWENLKKELLVSDTWKSHVHSDVPERHEAYQARLQPTGEQNLGPFLVLLGRNNQEEQQLAALVVNLSFIDGLEENTQAVFNTIMD